MHYGNRRREAMLLAIFPVAGLSLLNGFYKQPLYGAGPAWYWLADALQYVLVPVLCAWFLLRPAGIDARALGLRAERHGRAMGMDTAVVLAALMVMGTWPVLRVAHVYGWQYQDVLPQVLPQAWWARLLVAGYMAATAAVVEEIVFRALPWLYLREVPASRWRLPAYVVGSTVLFALCHAEQGPAGIIAAGWFGLVAAISYLRLRNLWPAVLAHFALDVLAFGPW